MVYLTCFASCSTPTQLDCFLIVTYLSCYSRFASSLSCQVTAVDAVEDEELKGINEKEANALEERLKSAGIPFDP